MPVVEVPFTTYCLRRCCEEYRCISNFLSLPERIAESEMKPWYELMQDELRFPIIRQVVCQGCHMPIKGDHTFRFLATKQLERATRRLTVLKMPFLQFDSGTRRIQLFYFAGQRVQMRVTHKPIRRSVINLIVFHPKHNAYRVLHQTFKYSPRNIPLNCLLNRLFGQAVGLMIPQLDHHPGFFCDCC